jgi:hypothetical protein
MARYMTKPWCIPTATLSAAALQPGAKGTIFSPPDENVFRYVFRPGHSSIFWRRRKRAGHDGQVALPPDLANGMIFTLMKNETPDSGNIHASMLLATPKPRLVKPAISQQGEDFFLLGGENAPPDTMS